MNLQSPAIGKDTSGNFKFSIKGLAVRGGPDGKFIARDGDQFVDVTDLTFDGAENYIYRLPVEEPKPRDIIIRSDNPFCALFVTKVEHHGAHVAHIEGFDPATNTCVEYCPPTNLLNCRFFVKIVSFLDNIFTHKNSCEAMAFLSWATKSAGSTSDDLLPLLLMSRSAGGKLPDDERLLLPLIFAGGNGSGNSVEKLLLLQAFGGANLFGARSKRPVTKSKP
jgi:hypothetical protein